MGNALFHLPGFFGADSRHVAHSATLHRRDVEAQASLGNGAALHVFGIGAITAKTFARHRRVAACQADGEARPMDQGEDVFHLVAGVCCEFCGGVDFGVRVILRAGALRSGSVFRAERKGA